MAILIASSVAFCFGVLLSCLMVTAGRASREEESRAIDTSNNEVYVGRTYPPKTNPEK